MIIFENYNNAKQKFGKLADNVKNMNVPDEYIDIICDFYIKKKINLDSLRTTIFQWIKYIDNHRRVIDGLSYEDMLLKLKQAKNAALRPNPIYEDAKVFIGEFKTLKDIKRFPIQNKWCISKDNNYFNRYKKQGDNLYIIDLKNEQSSFLRFLIMIINVKGNISFWDFDNQQVDKQYWSNFLSKMTTESKKFIKNKCLEIRKQNNI